MNVKELLNDMEMRALDRTFLNAVVAACKAEDHCRAIEEDYRIANEALKKILIANQMADLVSLEAAWNENRTYAANYGFKAGVYCGFLQHLTEIAENDGGFEETVCKDLFQEPRMRRHRDTYNRRNHCNELEARISNALDDEATEHLTSIVCAWENREHNAALQGFYCGYRAAWGIIEQVKPLSSMEGISKILTSEYYLGYICQKSEME